jgi:nicotinamide riboside kinase
MRIIPATWEARTDLYVIQIYWSFMFGVMKDFHRFLLTLEAIVKHHRYDFTLLCSPDLPWVHDSLRENPNDRDRLFIKYKSMLDQLRYHME